MMIKPTVGRMVWFYPFGSLSPDSACLAAVVTKVWNDRMVNLCVFGEDGTPYPKSSVSLHHDDGQFDYLKSGTHCAWMPFQKGQARLQEVTGNVTAFPPLNVPIEAQP
jgi:hypothetical protein